MSAIHINAKSALIPLDPGPGVTKDPSKTFYFRDVLNFIFKRNMHVVKKRNMSIINT